MRDIRRLLAAMQEVTGAVKLNYEVHGNSIPHLHMHFYPRYPGDPFEGGPIYRKFHGPIYTPDEFAEFRTRLLQALLRASSA